MSAKVLDGIFVIALAPGAYSPSKLFVPDNPTVNICGNAPMTAHALYPPFPSGLMSVPVNIIVAELVFEQMSSAVTATVLTTGSQFVPPGSIEWIIGSVTLNVVDAVIGFTKTIFVTFTIALVL
jgi:hypothetical protein